MNRTKKLGTCVAAAFTIFAGSAYLSTPVEAAEAEAGCSIDEQAAMISFAWDACQSMGYDYGFASNMSCDGGYSLTLNCG